MKGIGTDLSPDIEEGVSALAQLYLGLFCFALTMQCEPPRSQQPRAALAGEMFLACA